MSKQRHTPGPWHQTTTAHLASKGYFEVYAQNETEPIAHVIGEANARLIAAAPAMLEALKGSTAMFELLREFLPVQKVSFVRDQIKFNNSAIAKVEGQP